MEQQKATPVRPPEPTQNVVEVDMTEVYLYIGGLAVTTGVLAATTFIQGKLLKKNRERIEALSEYTSRLINETTCGQAAYETLLGEYEDEEDEEGPVKWEDDYVLDDDEEDEPAEDDVERVVLRPRVRDNQED